jgi:hypothetical protein
MHPPYDIHSIALKLAGGPCTAGSVIPVPDDHETIRHILKNFIFTIKKMKSHNAALEVAIYTPKSPYPINSFICPLLPHTVSSASFVYDNQEFTASIHPIMLAKRSPTPY